MRAIVQRVSSAEVMVDEQAVGTIKHGLCCFVGAGDGDTDIDLRYVADKIAGLRVFQDENGKMSRDVKDVGGEILLISQFTLYGDVRRGRRPSFSSAMAPEAAREVFARFVEFVNDHGVKVETGQFAADMQVLVDNDGPVSILIDSKKNF